MGGTSRRGRWALWFVAMLAVAGLVASGCSSGGSSKAETTTGGSGDSGSGAAPAEIAHRATFEIDGADMAYSFPEPTAPSGNVTVTFVNKDKTLPHQAQLFVLHPGVTVDQFTKALLSPAGEGAVVPLADPAGGPNAVGPGERSSVVVDLKPGATYMVVCALPAADGKPHYAHGMIGQFTVSSTSGGAAAPKAASTITLSDFAFHVPEGIDWSNPVAVVNHGSEPHELAILAPAQGKTVSDVEQALETELQGPPPFTEHGGVGAIPPGMTQVFTPQLKPGSYLLACFVVDPKTMKPHYMLGMVRPFTVA